jgi:hypothetical protein
LGRQIVQEPFDPPRFQGGIQRADKFEGAGRQKHVRVDGLLIQPSQPHVGGVAHQVGGQGEFEDCRFRPSIGCLAPPAGGGRIILNAQSLRVSLLQGGHDDRGVAS